MAIQIQIHNVIIVLVKFVDYLLWKLFVVADEVILLH